MVASMCQWSEQVKLVNIATRLKGEAYAFTGHVLPPNVLATPF